MQSINRLGFKVVGLTSGVLLIVFGLYAGTKTYLARDRGAPQLAQTDSHTTPAGQDSDNDGLSDQLEALYHTDANKPDTDGDGVKDALEITQGHDPSVAGIQDESRPLTGKNVTNLTTYTQRYLATLPEDIPRDDILRKERLESFVSVNKGPLLPTSAPGDLKTNAGTDQAAISAYLDQISASHNPVLHRVTNDDIQTAFTELLQLQPQKMNDIVSKLEQNVTTLKAVEAPAEVVALHTKLVAASQSLVTNTKLLQSTNNDFVAGLIGSKNIEELAALFNQIATEIKGIEQKYGLR